MGETAQLELAATAASVGMRDLHKEFDGVPAVKRLNMHVEPGELLVLLGPSGCGKSTTLRMIAGLEVPTAGTVHIGDRDVTDVPPQRRDIAMVFQNYALYPHKTVAGNLRFPLKKMDLSEAEIEARVMEAAELLEIDDLLEKTPGGLSGGQQQRVALGRTIVTEPKVFLMDEPLSNLDQKLRVYARAEIRNLQQEIGTTTIYVTHDQEEAMSLADRVAIMLDGQIEQLGTPEEVYEHPVNEFVAGFLGEPEMNFVRIDGNPELVNAMLDGHASAVSTIGFRPHEVHLARHVNRTDGRRYSDEIPMQVEVIEPLGDIYEVQLSHGEHRITAEFDEIGPDVGIGNSVDVAITVDRLHYFDADGSALEGIEADG